MTNKIDELQIAYDFLYSKQIKNVSKLTLENIKKACEKLSDVNAEITPTSVAEFVQNNTMMMKSKANGGFPPQRAQAIANNDDFKAFVGLYQQPKDALINKDSEDKKVPQYPVLGLDNKTKAYINVLVNSKKALERENKNLSDQLTTKTMTSPFSLLGSEEHGAVNNNEMVLIESTKDYPFSMPDLVSIIQKIPKLAESFPHIFKIMKRNGKQAMSITTPSKEELIFNSKDMKIISNCSDNFESK
jgi:hypothetical protein